MRQVFCNFLGLKVVQLEKPETKLKKKKSCPSLQASLESHSERHEHTWPCPVASWEIGASSKFETLNKFSWIFKSNKDINEQLCKMVQSYTVDTSKFAFMAIAA